MDFLAGLGIPVILLLVLFELLINSIGLYASSATISGFRFDNKKTILIAGVLYGILHIFAGFLLGNLVQIGIFSGLGLGIGYFLDVFLLWTTDKALKDFEIESIGSLFIGAFILIFTWAVAWYFLLIVLGGFGVIDISSITKI